MMTIGKVIFKVGKIVIGAAVAAVSAKAAYSAVKSVKQTIEEIKEREEEKTHIDYSEDPDGVTVYEKEILSTKEKLQTLGWNFLDILVTPLPGKAGEIEENFWRIWTGVGMVVGGLGWGYIFCAADQKFDADATAKKYGGPIGDDVFAEAAYAADTNSESIAPGTIYAFGKDYSGKSCVGRFDYNQLKTRDEIVAESVIKQFYKGEKS